MSTRRRLLGLLLVLVLGACDAGASAAADGVTWDALAAPTGGSTESVSFEQLDQAVSEAVTMLLEAHAVEAGQVTIRGDTVHASSWTRFVDHDTYEHVAFRPTSPEPSPDDPVEVLAAVVTGGELRWAEDHSDATWRTTDARPPDPFGIDLPAMASGVGALDLGPDAQATVREALDGTRVWTVHESSGLSLSWVVSPEGRLQAFVHEQPSPSAGSGDHALGPPPLTGKELRLAVPDGAPRVAAPEVDTSFDIDRFELWQGLPRPGAPAG